MELNSFAQVGISLGLGLLVGLQREWAAKKIAGIRTFALVTVFGTLCGILAEQFGVLLLASGVIAVAVMVAIANLNQLKGGQPTGAGFTTEIAAFSMFAVGALIPAGQPLLATVTAAGIALILFWKEPLHQFTKRIGEADFNALATFILIALVVLPLLPERAYGPYEVFNPFKIWLLVVIIVGVSFGAYVAQRALGQKSGILLGGILGGLISSTATTFAYAGRSRSCPAASGAAAATIMIASLTAFARVLVEAYLMSGSLWTEIFPPIAAFMAMVAVLTAFIWLKGGNDDSGLEQREPPAALRAAISFGCLYALVLFAVAAAKDHFGDRGLFVVAALSGLTDMDAITLSVSEMAFKGIVDAQIAWRAILIGGMANIAFKACVVSALGSKELRNFVLPLFALSLAGGIALCL